jgi:hypothetical protein
VDIDLSQLPVPDWGLRCQTCGYLLAGLPSHRCPECGTPFDVSKLVRPWTRTRPPRFTGAERPLPDFGLACRACGRALCGAAADECPHCRRSFRIDDYLPPRGWVTVGAELCGEVPLPVVEIALGTERVPHVHQLGLSPAELLTGPRALGTPLLVPREFYLEVRWWIGELRRELEAARREPRADWTCAACGEQVPGTFDVCWNCQAQRT